MDARFRSIVLTVDAAELVFHPLDSIDLLLGEDLFGDVTKDIGAAVDFPHGIVIRLIVNEMNPVSLGPESCLDDFIKCRQVTSRYHQMVANDEQVHYAGKESMAT